MASYRIEYAKGVDKDLRKIPTKTADRIARAIDKLASEPRPACSVKLVGFDIEYRIRVGDTGSSIKSMIPSSSSW
jgi:mRNA-degrading endonuclease RelE of RelBE toxin-antitoxin system